MKEPESDQKNDESCPVDILQPFIHYPHQASSNQGRDKYDWHKLRYGDITDVRR